MHRLITMDITIMAIMPEVSKKLLLTKLIF
jgi:hypothetical protein